MIKKDKDRILNNENHNQTIGIPMVPVNINNSAYQNQNFYQPSPMGNNFNSIPSFKHPFDPNVPTNFNDGYSNFANVHQYGNTYQNKYFNGVPNNSNYNNNNSMNRNKY